MSTRATIRHCDEGFDWHLYRDLHEPDDMVFLSISGDQLLSVEVECNKDYRFVTLGISEQLAITLGLMKAEE